MTTTSTWRSPASATSGRFEGRDTGGVVSGFVVDAAPGRGADRHLHPYCETFVVLDGSARFTVREAVVEAGGGDVLTVPAGTPHAFVATGPDGVRLLGIHAAPVIEQTEV